MAKVKVDTVVIEIHPKQVRGEKDGKKYDFTAYHTFTKNNERLDVRLVKDASDVEIEEPSWVEVLKENMNLSKRYRYPRLYIQKIESVTPLKSKAESQADDDDLPF